MVGAHAHGASETLAARRTANRRRMVVAASINAALFGVTVVGGAITGSLALIADGGHVLSDLGAIGLGLLAATLAARPGGHQRTFGYQRTEVIAALVNGLALLVVAIVIVVAAIDRFGDPHEIDAAGVVVLGFVSLAGNGAATMVLAGGQRRDLNLEAVLRHSAADALGSLGVVVSGVLVGTLDWQAADPAASIAIALLIAAGSIRLIRDPVEVLMETAPRAVDVEHVGQAMCRVGGVREVHELHVWSVTPGFETLAAHVVVASGHDRDRARREIEFMLRDRFAIEHTTLQMEEEVENGLLQIET